MVLRRRQRPEPSVNVLERLAAHTAGAPDTDDPGCDEHPPTLAVGAP